MYVGMHARVCVRMCACLCARARASQYVRMSAIQTCTVPLSLKGNLKGTLKEGALKGTLNPKPLCCHIGFCGMPWQSLKLRSRAPSLQSSRALGLRFLGIGLRVQGLGFKV